MLAGGTYAVVNDASGTATFTVAAPAVPSVTNYADGTFVTGATDQVFTFAGVVLNTNDATGDKAKVVLDSATCADNAPVGVTAIDGAAGEVTNLGTADATSVAQSVAKFQFTTAGTYQVCYMLAGGTYAVVNDASGTATFTVAAPAVPSVTEYADGTFVTGATDQVFTFAGVALNTNDATGDKAKVVLDSATCADNAPVG